MNCPKCNKELNFPEDILKTFSSCPFCGGFLQEEQTENEGNPLTPIETILKNIVEEFGGLEIFSEENGSRLHRALITMDNDLASERDRLILANIRHIPQKLYSAIDAPKAEQQITDACQQNLLSFGLQENIANEVISWLANILKIPLEPRHSGKNQGDCLFSMQVDNAQHKELVAGRWAEMPLALQMLNIGSEISRANRWKSKGNQNQVERAVFRTLELIDLTIDAQRGKHSGTVSRNSPVCARLSAIIISAKTSTIPQAN